MPIGATSRDVKIRITGENLVGPAVQGARRELDLLDKSIGSIIGGKAGKLFGAAATGGAAGLIAGTLGATFAPALLGQVSGALRESLDASEQIARMFGVVTERSKELAGAIQNAAKDIRTATSNLVKDTLAPSEKSVDALVKGRFSLPAGFPLNFLGGKQGSLAAALQQVQADREKLQRQRLDPSAFGNIAAKFLGPQLANVESETWGAKRWLLSAGDKFWGVDRNDPLSLLGGLSRDEMAEAKRRANQQALRSWNQREQQLLKGEGVLTNRESQLRAMLGLEAGAQALGARGQAAAGLFGNIFGTAGRGLFGALGGAVSGFNEARQMNIAGRLATESPVETLRRELGNLDRDRRQGLSAEVFSRRRNMLLKDAIAGLDAGTRTPDLVAAESRYLTRGRDRDPVQAEIAEWRKEQRNEQRKNQELLKELIKATKAEAGVKVEIE